VTISPADLQHKKLSCNGTLLNRCTTTERCWKSKEHSRYYYYYLGRSFNSFLRCGSRMCYRKNGGL